MLRGWKFLRLLRLDDDDDEEEAVIDMAADTTDTGTLIGMTLTKLLPFFRILLFKSVGSLSSSPLISSPLRKSSSSKKTTKKFIKRIINHDGYSNCTHLNGDRWRRGRGWPSNCRPVCCAPDWPNLKWSLPKPMKSNWSSFHHRFFVRPIFHWLLDHLIETNAIDQFF